MLVVTFVVPFQAWGGAAPLGTARAARGVKASLDNGTTWLEMKGSALPVFAGTELRSAGGSATIELKDGSRIEVLPFSAVRFEQVSGDPRISLTYGRVSFALHPSSKTQFVTPVARLESTEPGSVAGEVFVTGGGVMGLKMAEGRLNVHPTTPGGQTMVASNDPVFVPKRPAGSGPLFAADGPMTPPAGAKAIFAPSGDSVGYIAPDGGLAIHPGYTADLTQPFSPKLVRLAMNTIQEEQRDDATPLFDVNGGYVGYLSGPVFFAQTNFGGPNPNINDNPSTNDNHDRSAGTPLQGSQTGGTGPSISPKLAMGAGAVAAVGGGAALAIGGHHGGSGSNKGPSVRLPCPASPVGPGPRC